MNLIFSSEYMCKHEYMCVPCAKMTGIAPMPPSRCDSALPQSCQRFQSELEFFGLFDLSATVGSAGNFLSTLQPCQHYLLDRFRKSVDKSSCSKSEEAEVTGVYVFFKDLVELQYDIQI